MTAAVVEAKADRRCWARLPSPVGELLLTGTPDVLTGLHFPPHPSMPPDSRRDPAAMRGAVDQLRAYFAGELTDFELALAPAGTVFQLEVWTALLQVPYGRTCSYLQLARRVDRPAASRAVGLAVGRNPIAVVIPCHRVIGADGSLTGYAGGLDRKQLLLDHERRVAAGGG